ncbi:MAG: Ribosomal silencing factor RsfS [Chlamydiales bacterium]|nr:Ribosomal silencing factor RsfS [Chlamydiales bacterium]MCH9635395.1 Ribosomal silencing factor RsfS [Chlamydiales bacterium]
MIENLKAELDIIAQTLFDKKGFNILALDVREISTLTDYYIIAEGNVERHVAALGKAVIERLKEEDERPIHVEGLDLGEWVVIDYLGVVVHLFRPGMRERYRLEELWQDAEVVDLGIEVSHESK